MKIIQILAHPKPGSFNHVIAETVRQTLVGGGHSVIQHDLYLEKFDPVLITEEITAKYDDLPQNIKNFIDEIKEAEGLVFVHPDWWSGPPAILRGWIDRVFRQGFAYRFTEKGPIPLLGDKTVQIFVTANSPEHVIRDVYGVPIEKFWRQIVFGLCGAKSVGYKHFTEVILSDLPKRQGWLREVEEIVKKTF